MSLEILGASIGQVLVLAGFFFWLSKRSTEAIEKMSIDIAVIKNIIQAVQTDHDKVITLQSYIERLTKDVDCAHEKIRALGK
jgi:hypothetical protein